MAKTKLTEKEFIEIWERTRRKGFLSYIIVQGGISWGLFSGIIYIVLLMIAGIFIDMPQSDSLAMNKLFQLALFFAFGMVIGTITWYRNEKRYLKKKPYNKKKK